MTSVLWFLVGGLIGMLITCIVCSVIFRKPPNSGVLQIDRSNPEKDVYRLLITDEFESLSTKKHIYLLVDNNVNLSQK